MQAATNLTTMFKDDEYVITGTYALILMGILPKGTNGDVDVIFIDPKPTTLEIIKRLNVFTGNTRNDTFFKIILNEVRYDVFITSTPLDDVITVDGVRCTTLPRIIRAKRGYNRAKDVLHLIRWRDQLFGTKDSLTDQLHTCTLGSSEYPQGGAMQSVDIPF